jgi:Domain of unknown function (DUF4410)
VIATVAFPRAVASRALLLALLATLVAGCASAQVSAARQVGAPSPAGPAIVYVADFDLDVRDVRTERGILPPPLPGLGEILPKPPGAARDRAARADEVVALMSRSLVKELEASGIQARRLGNREPPLTAAGWLVRGVFTSVQEGNQPRRAVVGFGAGHTDLQVLVAIDDLAAGAPKPMYSLETKADSGKLPGAVITLNPYVAAARFVIAGGDLDRNVKQSAAQIARQAARYVAEAKTAAR